VANLGLCGGLAGKIFEQLCHARAYLRAIAAPMVDALECEIQANVVAARNRVKVTETLNESAIAAIARIGCHHMVERALVGATAGQANYDHDLEFLLYCLGIAMKSPQVYQPHRSKDKEPHH
jgi:hypothetical protein